MIQFAIPIPKTRPSLQEISEAVIKLFCNPHADITTLGMSGYRREHWEAARWAIWVHGIGALLYVRLRGTPVFDELPNLYRSTL